jgi:hypothetical protein
MIGSGSTPLVRRRELTVLKSDGFLHRYTKLSNLKTKFLKVIYAMLLFVGNSGRSQSDSGYEV